MGGPGHEVATCVMCEKQFSYFRTRRRRRFCSQKCRVKHGRRDGGSARMKNTRKRLRKNVYRRKERDHHCVNCGEQFQSRQSKAKCCSRGCLVAHKRQLGLEQFKLVAIWCECVGCGVRFRPSRPGPRARQKGRTRADQRFCSKECEAGHPELRVRDPNQGPRPRKTSRVDPIKVFERDGWKCHLCGIKTPKRLRGTTDDRAPERDHIVSLADGGSDTYENSACACRRCNRLKGARSIGQLLLFG